MITSERGFHELDDGNDLISFKPPEIQHFAIEHFAGRLEFQLRSMMRRRRPIAAEARLRGDIGAPEHAVVTSLANRRLLTRSEYSPISLPSPSSERAIMSGLERGGDRRARARSTQPRSREAFAKRLHAGACGPVAGGERGGPETARTASKPSATARPALRPGGSDWGSCTGLVAAAGGDLRFVPDRQPCGTRKTEIADTGTRETGSSNEASGIGDPWSPCPLRFFLVRVGVRQRRRAPVRLFPA
jgi:hypothetical protein